jgi:beta-mannosidase
LLGEGIGASPREVASLEWRFQSLTCTEGTIQVSIVVDLNGKAAEALRSYGWDWGPVLMTIGPWKPITLHTYNIYLTDVDVRSDVSKALDVGVTVDLTLSEKAPGGLASVALKNAQDSVILSESNIKLGSGSARAEFHFSPGVLDLWYPVGFGKQPLYTVEVTISDSVSAILPRIVHYVA